MRTRVLRALILGLALMGTWQLGSGLYIHLKALLAQHLIESAWSRTLQGEREVRPWPWADTWPVARLQVPAQDIDLYVLADAAGRSLAFAPGHVSGSAAPGTVGNTIIAGHRDTHFQFLRELKPGSLIAMQTSDGAMHDYEMSEAQVLDVQRDYIEVQATEPTLTLLTCYPFEALVPGGPLRYAVIATTKRVAFPPDAYLARR
jgi:sortase A